MSIDRFFKRITAGEERATVLGRRVPGSPADWRDGLPADVACAHPTTESIA